MADFLEPGRRFDAELRTGIAARVPADFDAAFRSVVRHRIEWTMREGRALHEETARLWNAVR
jgi:2-amino-4-hydroxy-6-hydroxymethyldihydropteridine diphosphokinase